jgi:hypothetical protein
LEVLIRCYDELLPKTDLGKKVAEDPSHCVSLQNAYRLVQKLRLVNLPPQPDDRGFTIRQEIAALRNLWLACERLYPASMGQGPQPEEVKVPCEKGGPEQDGHSDAGTDAGPDRGRPQVPDRGAEGEQGGTAETSSEELNDRQPPIRPEAAACRVEPNQAERPAGRAKTGNAGERAAPTHESAADSGRGGAQAEGATTKKPAAKPRTGRKRLEDSTTECGKLKHEVYTYIQHQHADGKKPAAILAELKANPDRREQIEQARLKPNWRMVKAALAVLGQRERDKKRRMQDSSLV